MTESSATPVTIQFLGSGDAFGSGGRLPTCFYVDVGEFHFLVDCGAAALSGMKRWGVDPNRIDAILVSHLHGDHFGGLPSFLLEAQFVSKRTKRLVIAGPPGLGKRLRQAQEVLYPGSWREEFRFPLEIVELEARSPTAVGPLVVTGYPVVHPSGAPSYALRIGMKGCVLAYSGDTEWTHALVEASAGADLFVCEAYYFDKKVRFHLDYETLVEHRPELSCLRIILTHMSQEMLGRLGEAAFAAAEDGRRETLEIRD